MFVCVFIQHVLSFGFLADVAQMSQFHTPKALDTPIERVRHSESPLHYETLEIAHKENLYHPKSSSSVLNVLERFRLSAYGTSNTLVLDFSPRCVSERGHQDVTPVNTLPILSTKHCLNYLDWIEALSMLQDSPFGNDCWLTPIETNCLAGEWCFCGSDLVELDKTQSVLQMLLEICWCVW